MTDFHSIAVVHRKPQVDAACRRLLVAGATLPFSAKKKKNFRKP
jgi:hypothetical protein